LAAPFAARKLDATQTTQNPLMHKAKRRAAGYGRVSTDEEEQQTSYAAQVEYYTNYIQSNPAWEFVAVYADEGISGTSTKRREQFNQMAAFDNYIQSGAGRKP
jgi:predicted site-specific integrase-resolvase